MGQGGVSLVKVEDLGLKFVVVFLLVSVPVCVLQCGLPPQLFNLLVVSVGFLGLPVAASDLRRGRFLGFWAFFYALVVFMYDLPYGFDMTDEPFQVVLSYFLPEDDVFVPTNPLSYKLLHLVLGVFREPYLLFERFLGALVVSFVIYFAVKSVVLLAGSVDLAVYLFSLLAAVGFSFNYARFVMPYDQLPVLFFALLVFLGFLALRRGNLLAFLLFGMVWVLGLYLRLTGIIFSLLLLLVFVIVWVKERVLAKGKIFYFFVGILAGIVVLVMLKVDLTLPIVKLYRFDLNYCMPVSYEHDVMGILRKYLLDLKLVLIYLSISFPVVFVSNEVLSSKFGRKFDRLLVTVFVLILVFLFVFFRYRGLFYQSYLSWFYLGFGLFVSLYLLVMVKNQQVAWLDLIIVGLLLLFAFAGSNIGIRKVVNSGALGFSIIYLMLKSDLNKLSKQALIGWLLLVSALGFSYRYDHFYRDYGKCSLNKDFSKIAVLRGIVTSKAKVLEVEDFYQKIKTLNLNQNFITCNKTNLFSLALNRRPMAVCWMFNPESLRKSPEKPQYVIFSNHSLRYRDWDKRNVLAKDKFLPEIQKAKKILNSLYEPVVFSQNKIFVLYKLKTNGHD